MRTNIVIDDALMRQAMKVAGTRTKRETVERGLQLLIRLSRQKRIQAARGKLRWRGDLDAMRRDA
jgi:Arc/MetJ family transcription regulator